MNTKILLIYFILSLIYLNASESSFVAFKEASLAQSSEIQQHLISFYGEQLFEAGLVESLEQAHEAATIECSQDSFKRKFYYIDFVSNNFSTPCGYIAYSITDQSAYLDAIYLQIPYRGQGIGKQILNELEIELKKENIEEIKLYVFAHNNAAFMLYNRMGYCIETSYSNGNICIGHHMKKLLK